MQKKNTNFICMVLALFVFCFVAFTEKLPVELNVSFSSLENTDFRIDSASVVISVDQLCTTDMLRGNSTYGLKQMSERAGSSKRGSVISICFLLVSILLLQKTHFLRWFDNSNEALMCKNEPTIYYIHNSDGKKRI